jgi:hypothetical protein
MSDLGIPGWAWAVLGRPSKGEAAEGMPDKYQESSNSIRRLSQVRGAIPASYGLWERLNAQ